MQDGDPIHCKGCGRDTGARWPETPVPDRCGHCPPQQCPDCGQLDSATEHCPCWKSLEGMALADIKATFAASDLGIDLTRGRA